MWYTNMSMYRYLVLANLYIHVNYLLEWQFWATVHDRDDPMYIALILIMEIHVHFFPPRKSWFVRSVFSTWTVVSVAWWRTLSTTPILRRHHRSSTPPCLQCSSTFTNCSTRISTKSIQKRWASYIQPVRFQTTCTVGTVHIAEKVLLDKNLFPAHLHCTMYMYLCIAENV